MTRAELIKRVSTLTDVVNTLATLAEHDRRAQEAADRIMLALFMGELDLER